MKENNSKNLILIIAPFLYLIAAIIVVLYVANSGIYPTGDDTYYHLYRGNYIYNSIKEGNFYPLLDLSWYNGVELLRFWTPLCAYFMAFCQLLAGGNVFNGYLILLGLLVVLGGLPWLYIGYKENRPKLCAFLGLYWFFVPNNLYAIFGEGNIARSLAMLFLPMLLYEVYTYIRKPSWKNMLCISALMLLVALCHIGYALMVAAAIIIFLLIYIIAVGRPMACLEVIIGIIISFVLLGVWLIPFIFSDVSGVDSSEAMATFFQSIWITLNPFERLESDNLNFYYGLSVFVLDAFGIFYARREEKPAFITSVIFVILSCSSMYYVLKVLPGGQFFRMLRFFSILIALSLIALIYWNTLRRSLLYFVCILLILDTLPSLSRIKGDASGVSPDTSLTSMSENTLISEAKEITTQRMAFMDLSTLGADGAYLVSGTSDGVYGTFGAGWEAAATSSNISQLNRALTAGCYPYLFDRCLELGNDTVLIRLTLAETYEHTIDDIIDAAAVAGYTLVAENSDYILFHLEAAPEEGFGVVSSFRAIGIGSGAPGISLYFPALEETDSTKLDDFTYDELKSYDLIYLDGFTYDDRDYAEDLILRLSEGGVRVVIAADGIPEDRKTHDQSFLGVVCNTISFSNGYPELDTIDGILNTDLFPQGYEDWQTVYLEGLSDIWGRVYDNQLELPFYGTGQNENLVYIGINLTYFYGLTGDTSAGALLDYAMDFSSDELPERDIVPVSTVFDGKTLTIETDYDNVDTTIAYHDLYNTSSDIRSKNNLLYVTAGTTVIELKYPYLLPGIIVSLVGLVLLILYLRLINKEHEISERKAMLKNQE